MRKDYQNQEIDTSQPTVPDTVSVALAELAGEMREGLLALAVGTGLQVMAAIMEADVTAACGAAWSRVRCGRCSLYWRSYARSTAAAWLWSRIRMRSRSSRRMLPTKRSAIALAPVPGPVS